MKIACKNIYILSCLAKSLRMKLCISEGYMKSGLSLCMYINPSKQRHSKILDTSEFEDDEPIENQKCQLYCWTPRSYDFNKLATWMLQVLKDIQHENLTHGFPFLSGFHFDDFESLELDLVLAGKFKSTDDYEVDLESV